MDVTHSSVPVDELVTVVRNAIKQANVSNSDIGRDLRVVSVYLKLNTVATTTAGGGVDFRIPIIGMKFKMGSSVTHKDTHTVEMTLVPQDLLPEHEIRDGQVEALLVDAIETLRSVMVRAGEGDDPFLLEESTVEMSFAITEDGSISLGIDGELKDEVTHTLRLGLAIPSEAKGSA
jgi:hypothetical protein